jgi:hypothetical protein
MKAYNSEKKIEILEISRLLSPKEQSDLLTWVHLAYAAESSVRKSMNFGIYSDSVVTIKQQNLRKS